MMDAKVRHNILDGVTLASILDVLVKIYGFDTLSQMLSIRCFENNPSIPSTLKFLRQTPWARTKIEDLYVELKISQK